MKKVALITIIDNNNYGNRLQNYALSENIKKIGLECITMINEPFSNTKRHYLLRKIKNLKYIGTFSKNIIKKENFKNFNKNISFSTKKVTAFSNLNKYDYAITGSDQVWNPYFGRLRDVDLLEIIKPDKKISYAASFGIDFLPKKYKNKLKRKLIKFKAISVREEQGKKIIKELLPNRDVTVTLDPTLLLSKEEWDKVSKKPKMLNTDKYILMYFLGSVSQERKDEIERVAKENNCEIINILDTKSSYYVCGPSEFLYLEKHAFLICTDSFHSCVFGLIYNRPFVIFDRDDKITNMNSRIETLINTFKLENREYNGYKITSDNLNHNYDKAYKILQKEQKKSIEFLKNALK